MTAHPDDADFGSAGTVALFVDRGVEVTYLLATAGDAGGNDRALDNTGMAELRKTEQAAAAKAVCVTDVRFLGYVDGTVVPSLELRRDIARVIRQVRPDLVITHTPERNYKFIAPSHPDHRAVGGAALDAVYPDARNPYAFPELLREEGLEAWTVREVWLNGSMTPDHWVDITAAMDHGHASVPWVHFSRSPPRWPWSSGCSWPRVPRWRGLGGSGTRGRSSGRACGPPSSSARSRW